MKDIKVKILSNEKIGPVYFKMLLEASFIAKEASPGQFVQIQCNDNLDPLLRRPFSIHRVGNKTIEILYEVIGKGTDMLSKKKEGDFLDVLGPLGAGFREPSAACPERSRRVSCQPSAILIAGGMGVAPLAFLAEELIKKKIKVVVLIGAKTKKEILCEKDFRKIGAEVHVATDNGSKGFKGYVSKLFENLLSTACHERSRRVDCQLPALSEVEGATTYTCGPQPMLKSIAGICKKKKIACQVSVEEKMACGIGACLGCAVKVRGGYKLACKDGPVFNAQEIIWD